VGNAEASAQLGAYQQPFPARGEAFSVTVIGSAEVLVIWNRPSLMPGYHLRNVTQSGVIVIGEPAITGKAVNPVEVPSQRSNAPVPVPTFVPV